MVRFSAKRAQKHETQKHEEGPPWWPLFGKNVRRRPTLPRSLPRSTIGAEGLSFRVRNGTGRFPFAMATETLWSSVVRVVDRWQQLAVPDRNSGTTQWTLTHANLGCWLSPRPISTGRLHA